MHSKKIFSVLNTASRPLVVGAAFFAGYVYANNRAINNNNNKISINGSSTKQRALLIDWDNCLCDSAPRILKRLHLVSTELKRRHPNIEIDAAKLLIPCTGELSSHLRNLFGENYSIEAYSLYMEYMNHKDIPVKRPFEGAGAFLQTLKNSEIPFAIVSNGTVKFVKQGIEDFSWNQLLTDVPIITVDEVGARNKPDPFHFISALTSLKINLNTDDDIEIIIVGDGLDSDMLGALKLADQLAQPNITISAIWVNHNRSIPCRLNSVNSFDDLHQLLFITTPSHVAKF